MISVKARIIIIFGLIIALIVIVAMVRKRWLELKYVLVWIASAIAMVVCVCFPSLMDAFAHILGIYSTTNMIFFVGFLFLLVICFSLTITLSKVTDEVRKMAQIVSMIPGDIMDEIEKKINEEKRD